MTKFMPVNTVNRNFFVNFPIWPGHFYWLIYSSFAQVSSSYWLFAFSNMNRIKACKLPSAILYGGPFVLVNRMIGEKKLDNILQINNNDPIHTVISHQFFQ